MLTSNLGVTLTRIADQSAEAVSDFLRSNSPGLNRHIRCVLSAAPGQPGSLLADPVIEAAQDWAQADHSFGDLAGNLLDSRLVTALDQASSERMPRDRKPYRHQVRAWQAAGAGQSVLVSSGTGSGKTECFMIPILNDILLNPSPAGGIRAIIVYPLNALIQSQRDRLSAWAEGLGGSVTYALYNGDTPEKSDGIPGAIGEIRDRKSLRQKPPTILVTNVTMLEYMLLRAEDQAILKKSQGLLRWIVLDEAHSYVGAQASEMAMLLRRARAAFGVPPEDVRLIATSATIDDDTGTRLSEFLQGLSGVGPDRVTILKGEVEEAALPPPRASTGLDLPSLTLLPDDRARWEALAPNPRIQTLRGRMKAGLTLGEIALHAFDRADARAEAEVLLDLVAQARSAMDGLPLLRWRGHLFLRALGGAWVCLDRACPHSSADLLNASEWPFGQVHFTLRERCSCGAPCMELVICNDCGTPHLKAAQEFGVTHRLILPRAGAEDDFAADVEDVADAKVSVKDDLWVTASPDRGRLVHINPESLAIVSNSIEVPVDHLPLRVIDANPVCPCNETRTENSFKYLRFSPAFLMGHNMQTMIEAFSLPDPDPVLKPMAGRGAISFTDSRQGVARLAAKLQAEAERSLTRGFLWHETQSAQAKAIVPEEVEKLEAAVAALLAMGMEPPASLVEDLSAKRSALTSVSGVKWITAVADLAAHPELGLFVREVWKDRGDEFVNHNEALAQVLLMREIMRRPKRQNNAETMGLARLVFPELERAVLTRPLPSSLRQRSVAPIDYLGLVLSAVDLFFREKMVVALQPEQHMRWIAPKWGRLRQACANNTAPADRLDAIPFPSALVKGQQRMHRLALNALTLLGGSRDCGADLEDADALLHDVYRLIVAHACKVWSTHAVALDFARAELQPYREAWACPVSRRVFGYAIKGCSPLDATRPMQRLTFPSAPFARRGGLTPDERVELADWLAADPGIVSLRVQGAWTGLHNRAVLYSAYMRAQEHSAQLPRSQLKEYEADFNAGRINLLACSTTMEMGVDLSNVGLVVNANVPPSVANYRQRVGRAGRRREPWAFGVTWCRDMPLDNKVFEDPRRLLHGQMTPPRVVLNSPILIGRHVNAAAFAGWLRHQGGMRVLDKIGPFFGMDQSGKVQTDAQVDRFIAAMTGTSAEDFLPDLSALLRASCLEGLLARELGSQVAQRMQAIVDRWRSEYKVLIQRGAMSGEKNVSSALASRASTMHSAYLLSELAREGFIPAYGFPSDVVTFDYIGSGRGYSHGALSRNGASRTLDVALREYAPGSDVVINSLVYTSEGIRPAWSTQGTANHLEDLRQLWKCPTCGKPHLSRALPEICGCGALVTHTRAKKTLRPVGFVGRSQPHIGYELLRNAPYRMPEISADDAALTALPGEAGWSMRATPKGQVITLGSGEQDAGYAICLICGRAASEALGTDFGCGPLPVTMVGHRPLVTGDRTTLVSGRCLGGEGSGRIQRHVHLVHDRATDVFELQLPHGTGQSAAYALAAGMRESLVVWLGVKTEEVGIAVGLSMGLDQSKRVSAYLFDRAAGGAGLSLRLGEEGRLVDIVLDTVDRLTCPERCTHGCPACILRPDMNLSQVLPDRLAGLDLAKRLGALLTLEQRKQVFGPGSFSLGISLFDLISQRIGQGTALSVTIFARGKHSEWNFSEWLVSASLDSWRQKVPVEIVFSTEALEDSTMDVATRLRLMRLAYGQVLAHLSDMPRLRIMPLLAVIKTSNGLVGVAAAAQSEAFPNEAWGSGTSDLLISGPMEALPKWNYMPLSNLLPKAESGRSAHIIMGSRLDVGLSQFGKVFWQIVKQDAPILHALLVKEGVVKVDYNDRYLIQPFHFKLLQEIFFAIPGSAVTTLRVGTMFKTPSARPTQIDHLLACDADRKALFGEMFPGASLFIRNKKETEHSRYLILTTAVGSKVMIYFDQGMDLWKLAENVKTSYGSSMPLLAQQMESINPSLGARITLQPTMFLCLV